MKSVKSNVWNEAFQMNVCKIIFLNFCEWNLLNEVFSMTSFKSNVLNEILSMISFKLNLLKEEIH